MAKVQVDSEGKLLVTSSGKALKVDGFSDNVSALNDTGSTVSIGDKVWICKNSGDDNLYLRSYSYTDQYSFTGFATSTGTNGSSVNTETIFPENMILTLTSDTDNVFLDVR